LFPRVTIVRLGMNLPKSRGMGPDKLLLYKYNAWRLVAVLDKLVGICPVRPL
jgi:hypothetical protein